MSIIVIIAIFVNDNNRLLDFENRPSLVSDKRYTCMRYTCMHIMFTLWMQRVCIVFKRRRRLHAHAYTHVHLRTCVHVRVPRTLNIFIHKCMSG